MFEPVVREKAKLRMAISGVTGAGKTLGALYIAYGITGDWGKVALLDTEHGRGRFYASRDDLATGQYLYAELIPPYSPEKYQKAIIEGAKAVGPDGVIVIDSFSHAWSGAGGILEIKDEVSKRQGQNSYTAWGEAGKYQNNLVGSIFAAPCHTIITLRSKMDYTLVEDERGKKKPVKVGLAPVQRDDVEYEFDTVLDLSREHFATTVKDTTILPDSIERITPEIGRMLAEWLSDGEEPKCCETCGKPIHSYGGRSIGTIIENTKKEAGKQLCIDCFKVWLAEKKKAEQRAGNHESAT